MNKRIQHVDFTTINKILDEVKQYTKIRYEEWKKFDDDSLASSSFIEDKQIRFEITTKWYENKPCTYIFTKNNEDDIELLISTKGSDAYRTLRRYYKVPDFRNTEMDMYIPRDEWGKYIFSAQPLLGYNKKYNMKETYLYEYDINSAYSDQMLKPCPNTSCYTLFDIVRENQVGFMFDKELTLVDQPGLYADIVFDLMESPFTRFVDTWYGRKKKAKNMVKKKKAKEMLNFSIGYMQRTNPFLRAFIIHNCNKRIQSLLDDNVALWNTDAIYSTVRRPELELGNDLGQWKIEEGLFRIRELEYQKVGEAPHFRGVPRSWFPPNFNLLTDKLPTSGNIYKFNIDKFRIEEMDYNEACEG